MKVILVFCSLHSYAKRHIETQNLGKAQALGTLPAVAPLNISSNSLKHHSFAIYTLQTIL